MAKLNARGREEWLRLSKVDELAVTGDLPPRKVRRLRAYMSDGHLLERDSYLKADGTIDFDSGWKDVGKSRVDFDIEAIKARRTAEGWTVVRK